MAILQHIFYGTGTAFFIAGIWYFYKQIMRQQFIDDYKRAMGGKVKAKLYELRTGKK